MKQIETEKRRMAILRHLLNSTNTECGDGLLAQACRAQGIVSTGPEVIAAISWLVAHELAESERFGEVVIAKLTRTGKQVARGEMVVPGVCTVTDFD